MNTKSENPKPLLVISNPNKTSETSWDEWLFESETKLKKMGYKKYNQNHKKESFGYSKNFKTYLINILFYDFRKYADRGSHANRIGIMYECMLLCNHRIDMQVSKNIDLLEFEIMSQDFYQAMIKFIKE